MGIIERQETLTSIARNTENDASDRNRAIDLLNKMDGVYVMRVDLNVNCNISSELAGRLNSIGR